MNSDVRSKTAEALVNMLRAFKGGQVFNPWRERDPLDLPASAGGSAVGPAGRRARLAAHFSVRPVLLLVGEAAGYQGCHFSGIPFTNERLLAAGRIPRTGPVGRLTRRPLPWCEPSATVVWGALHDFGIAERVVLWNSFAWHPFVAGKPYSNRAPTRDELSAGEAVLDRVLDAFAGTPLIAVGKVAERTLLSLGRRPHCAVRHPSMGGAMKFRAGLATIVRDLGIATAAAAAD
jgi:hypothetical protein